MRLSISNIAWDSNEDVAIAALLRQYGVDAIDIAPGKYFPRPLETRQEEVERVRDWWVQQGMEIVGMQALLFGTTGLNLFGPPDVQQAMLTHLDAVCRIAGQLGAPKLVFGSPKNRDRSLLTDEETHACAVSFFQRLGDMAQQHAVVVCLEPNPTHYGANFMTTSSETARIVEAVAHPAIRMQLDTGAIAINRESISQVLSNHAHLIGHIHLSDPDLAPLGDHDVDHRVFHSAISAALPHHLGSIEMRATTAEPPVVSVERALRFATRHYRPEGKAAA